MNEKRKIHELKTWIPYFDAVLCGAKTFEIRKNDRDFQVNDLLDLHEYDSVLKKYTGRCLIRRVTYITNFEQPDGQIVMGLGPC